MVIIVKTELITLLLLSFICATNSVTCRCKTFENNLYQVTAQLPNLKPFYGLLTLLPNGMAFETNNIANGQNAAEVGVDLSLNVHSGYYDCLSGNKLSVISTGYIYKTTALPILSTNGAIAVHHYDLQFLKNDNRQCTGTLRFAFYTTGTNPFDSSNTRLLLSAVANVTCEYLNGRGFTLPANGTA